MARRQPWRLALGVLLLLLGGIAFVAGHNRGEDHGTLASSKHNKKLTVKSAAKLVEEAHLALTRIGLARFRRMPTTPQDHQHGTGDSYGYHISPELAEAARLLAESSPQIPAGNHSEVAATARSKFRRHASSTHLGRGQERHGNNSNSKSWMPDMASQGASPLAPPGYQVWRNVKDYGAIGDGVADDTAAISRAIWSGGRRGADCGAVPAVVYF